MTSTVAPDLTAQAILDATLLVVGELGLRGATTRLIAERAGVNEVTLFRKFGSKMSLIAEAIHHRFATVQAEAVAYTGDVQKDLIRLAERYQRALEVFGSFARVMLTEVQLEPQLAGASRGAEELFGAISAMLGRYQAEGVVRPEPAESLIPAFLGPIAMPHVLAAGGAARGLASPRFDARAHVERFLYGRVGGDTPGNRHASRSHK